MPKHTESEKKFETGHRPLLEVWNEIQRIQTDFCFSQELSVYYMSDFWLHNAQTVLDVGTGNGYYLEKLCQQFPDKSYRGIDISAEFIEIAEKITSSGNIAVEKRDFFDVEGRYDFVIMRLFWQHLPRSRCEEALVKMADICREDSSVLIVDACDHLRCFAPPLPEFQRVIKAYSEQQLQADRDRSIVNAIKQWAEGHDGWSVGCDLSIILPSTIPGYLDCYRRVYELWIDLFEILGELEMDFHPAKSELAEWRTNENAYTQAGLRLLRLDRLS